MTTNERLTRRDCLALLSALTIAPSFAESSRRYTWKSVQVVLDDFVRERSAPGVALAICRGDAKPAYPHSGTIAFDSNQAFDADSICRIYSMTKNVTRIATLLLVEDGKLALDQPVTDYLPEFRNLRVADRSCERPGARPARNR